MKFKGMLGESAKEQVRQSDRLLADPGRLKALQRVGLMGTPSEEAFDRLADLAAKIQDVPLTVISFIDDEREFFKAAHGLPSPFNKTREIPVDGSICRYTLAGEAIIAPDASIDALLMHHPATEPWGIGAFMSIPMTTKEGHVLGAFCAIDYAPRQWSQIHIYAMKELTASVMTEINLREQVRDLELERELRERFVATLSHDLRTPLNVIRMGAELLRDNSAEANKNNKITRMICENIDRADHMIRDILDVSSIKAGQKVHLELEDCNLSELIEKTVEALSNIHGPRFVIQAPSKVIGRWDPMALRRLLENLIGNAVKYGSESTPITIGLGVDEDWVSLSVHNEGPAIAPESLASIFSPYQRSASAFEGKQKGWGIGLTLVRGLAEAHGGTASVVSQEPSGTTFTVRLPMYTHPT